MRAALVACALVVITAALASQVFAQSDEGRPANLPTDINVQAFSNRAEGATLATLAGANPLIEGYFQGFAPSEKLGYVLFRDRYVLGRFRGSQGPSAENLLTFREITEGGENGKSESDQQLLDGLLDIMVPDWKQLGPDRYEYRFMRLAFLGAVRCLVYEVKPIRSETHGFTGRIYIEDKSWNIVRFTGMSANVDAMFSAMRNQNSRFRIDSWRVNVAKGRWMPAYAYVEEVAPLGAPDGPLVKAQIRFWGYDKRDTQQQDKFVDVILDESPSTTGGRKQQWPSPQQSQRSFEKQAEENVLARLFQGRFLGAPGEVEKLLDQVVTNLIVTNNLVLGEPVHCRVLLTTPFETFTVGNTIVISRGLIDVLPSESAVALVLAHQLAHNILGHRKVDTKLAFADVLSIPDAELLAKLRFGHSPSEEAAADTKAMEILERSPYNNALSDGGLFLQSLQARVKQLTDLIQPHFGEHVADAGQIVRNNDNLRTTPVLDEEQLGQVSALPLGSKLLVNPWNGRVELFRSEPLVAPSLRERADFAVTPFNPFLDYFSDKTAVPPLSTVSPQQGVRPPVQPTVPTGTKPQSNGVKSPSSPGNNKAAIQSPQLVQKRN